MTCVNRDRDSSTHANCRNRPAET